MWSPLIRLSIDLSALVCIVKVYMKPSLNPGAGERAVLIKTEEGDSLILIGKWTGVLRGVPASIRKHFSSFKFYTLDLHCNVLCLIENLNIGFF